MLKQRKYYYVSYTFMGGYGNCYTMVEYEIFSPLRGLDIEKLKIEIREKDKLQGVSILNIMRITKTEFKKGTENN